ncbi:MAG: 4'-phosphopantetheinyl transferase superfamily protein [Clostridia bacterium]|nr:4'-phosphopantetheinyl transferase superfamily protein [Clostridia bacterium]
MIRILGCRTDEMTRDGLMAKLPTQWQAAWRDAHGTVKNDRRAAESLTALCLLQRLHPAGTLCYDAHGRPYFAERDVDFSIAHTEDACFCAVASGRVGLDAETLARADKLNARDMAARWLTPAERQAWEREPTAAHFLRIWTRKEALVKRSGEGLRALRAADSEAGTVRFFEARDGNLLITLAYAGEDEISLEWI